MRAQARERTAVCYRSIDRPIDRPADRCVENPAFCARVRFPVTQKRYRSVRIPEISPRMPPHDVDFIPSPYTTVQRSHRAIARPSFREPRLRHHEPGCPRSLAPRRRFGARRIASVAPVVLSTLELQCGENAGNNATIVDKLPHLYYDTHTLRGRSDADTDVTTIVVKLPHIVPLNHEVRLFPTQSPLQS